MLCCGQCFNDRELRQLIAEKSTSEGSCPTCGFQNAPLIEARMLAELFGPLCAIYTPDPTGRVLVDWLIDDWEVFSLDWAKANILLMEILDDGERIRQAMVPSNRCRNDRLEKWELLRDELRFRNRFFPETDIELKSLENLLVNHLTAREGDVPESWWRARISRDGKSFSRKNMGPPPQDLTTHGRANPAGIPYLYLGSAVQTAIAEVRPHPGEMVCVADFKIRQDAKVRLLDLRNPRDLVSPFIIGDESEIAALRGDVEFLERIGSELTTPVLPSAAPIDYIPSQYLCEFIKKRKYDGVLYSSSVSNGVNFALFDPGKASVGRVKRYTIKSVDVDFREVP